MSLLNILSISSESEDIGCFDLFERKLSDLVNTFSMSKVYKMVDAEVVKVHKENGLDRRFIDFATDWILCYSDCYNKHYYDLRNEEACKECYYLRTTLVVKGIIGSGDTCKDSRITHSSFNMHRTLIQSATQVILYAMIRQAELNGSTGLLRAIIATTPDTGEEKNVEYALKHYTSMPLI